MARARAASIKIQTTSERPLHKRHRTPPPTLHEDEDAESDAEQGEQDSHIPRPRNAWIIFRSTELDKHKEFDQHGKIVKGKKPQAALSKEIAIRWRAFTPQEKQPYTDMAEREKEEHKRLYPGYKFQPKSKEVKAAMREAERTAKAKVKAQQQAAVQHAKVAALRKYTSTTASPSASSPPNTSSSSTNTAHSSYPSSSSYTAVASKASHASATANYNTSSNPYFNVRLSNKPWPSSSSRPIAMPSLPSSAPSSSAPKNRTPSGNTKFDEFAATMSSWVPPGPSIAGSSRNVSGASSSHSLSSTPSARPRPSVLPRVSSNSSVQYTGSPSPSSSSIAAPPEVQEFTGLWNGIETQKNLFTGANLKKMAAGFGLGKGKPTSLSARLGLDGRIKKKKTPPSNSNPNSRSVSGASLPGAPRIVSGSNLRYVSNGSVGPIDGSLQSEPIVPEGLDFTYAGDELQDDLNMAFGYQDTQAFDAPYPHSLHPTPSSSYLPFNSSTPLPQAPTDPQSQQQDDVSASSQQLPSSSYVATTNPHLQATVMPSEEPFAFNVEFNGNPEDVAAAFGFTQANLDLASGAPGAEFGDLFGLDLGAFGDLSQFLPSELDLTLNWGDKASSEALQSTILPAQVDTQTQLATPRDPNDPSAAFPQFTNDIAHQFFQQLYAGEFNLPPLADLSSEPLTGLGLGLELDGAATGLYPQQPQSEAQDASSLQYPAASTETHRTASGASSSSYQPQAAPSPWMWDAGTPYAARNSSAEYQMATMTPNSVVYDAQYQQWYASSPHQPAPEAETPSAPTPVATATSLNNTPYHRARNFTGPIDLWDPNPDTEKDGLDRGLMDKLTPTSIVAAQDYVPPVGATNSGRRVGGSWARWMSGGGQS